MLFSSLSSQPPRGGDWLVRFVVLALLLVIGQVLGKAHGLLHEIADVRPDSIHCEADHEHGTDAKPCHALDGMADAATTMAGSVPVTEEPSESSRAIYYARRALLRVVYSTRAPPAWVLG